MNLQQTNQNIFLINMSSFLFFFIFYKFYQYNVLHDKVDDFFLAELPGVLQVVPSRTLQLHAGPGRLH